MKPIVSFCITLMAALFVPANILAQVRINEAMAQNNSFITDPDFDGSADWIELCNYGSDEVDLSGFYVTDNLTNPTKYALPAGTVIKANGYLVLWCDDRGEGLHPAFKLSADGEQIGLFDAEGNLVDSLSFGVQHVDISYGRRMDKPESLAYFMKPTPGAANDAQAYDGLSNQPMILTPGGFFSGSATVSITNDLGGTVYYTTDGSQPTTQSQVYTGPLTFTKTTVLRARIIADDMMPGNVMTETYFIDEAFAGHELPVVSIATEEANFWDAERGIYVQDFKPDWEVPVNIEMFLNNGSDRSAFNERAGIKVNGLYAWQLPQKMLGVYFKKKYGESKLAYQLFTDDSRNAFDNFALRASGSDWSYTLMRDGLVQQAARRGNMNLDLMAFRPCVVYVNGQFMGVHNIREKVDEDYVEQHYGLASSEFDMVEGGDTPEVGTVDAWNDFFSFATKADLTNADNWSALEAQCDIENFSDYLITEIYSGNTSLAHNTMTWKPIGSGQWRWILMDTDRGFFRYDNNLFDYYIDKSAWPLSNMLENETYKRYFFKRAADHLFTTYNTNNILRQIDEHKADIEPLMQQHIQRWQGTTSSYGDAMKSMDYWLNEVNKLRDFAVGRVAVLTGDLVNYGMSAPAMLSLSSFPANACTYDFNGHAIDNSYWSGLYPQDTDIRLTARHREGYRFCGWRQARMTDIIPRGSMWKYLDDGSDQGTQWQAVDFDDAAWQEGGAPLGYGHSNIKTTVSYGSSSNKHITTYFRKHFDVNIPVASIRTARIYLLREDAAIVYLNGQRIITSNITIHPQNLTYKTLSKQAIGGSAEKTYVVYDIDPSLLRLGHNVFAVEVHQTAASSSDLEFDIQLQVETLDADNALVSEEPTVTFSLNGDRSLCAIYEPTGESIVPDSIHTDFVLTKARSPWLVTGDVVVDSPATLTIEPGVEVYFSPDASMYIHGRMDAQGTASDSIVFCLNPKCDPSLSWGALCFIHTGDRASTITYATLRDANKGPLAYNCVAAISGFGTTLRLDHLNITDVRANPITARYSDVRLTNSVLHADITGDLINVKYGKGYISDCEFIGNRQPDTDAIDYDGISGGVIRRVIAHDFLGSNSDAIDLGEQAEGVIVDSIMVYNITDKGISIGQRSSVSLSNSTFIQTNLGVGVKDSCSIEISGCTFFAVQTPISCYEKVIGRAGGNAMVRDCVFSNSSNADIACDDKSFVSVSRSLSDTHPILFGTDNLLGDPGFTAPTFYDLTSDYLRSQSLGSNYLPAVPDAQPLISHICYAPFEALGESEFVAVANPTDLPLDISGYSLSNAISFTFPEGTVLPPHEQVYVAKSVGTLSNEPFIWDKGKLANEGETIELTSPAGIVVDHVAYTPSAPWPVIGTEKGNNILVLTDLAKGNHLAANWTLQVTTNLAETGCADYLSYDARSRLATAHLTNQTSAVVTLFDLSGRIVRQLQATNGTQFTLPGGGTYILHFAGKTYKLMPAQ